ncbi:MAG: sodium:calcium antiporter [Candidatus Hodarchaeales archaeon]|jgi:cation:H+ antiporter
MAGDLIIWIFLFLVGYITIYFAADYLIDLLEEFSEVYAISPVIVGLFVLGIDLEESIVSLIAAHNELPYLSLGNLIGNTIIAVAIAFGLPAFFLKFRVKQLPFFYYGVLLLAGLSVVLSTIFPQFLIVFALFNGILFGSYIAQSYKVQKDFEKGLMANNNKKNDIEVNSSNQDDTETEEARLSLLLKVIGVILLIFAGGEALVISAEQIMQSTGVSETFFGLVIMAFVTNVEEFWLIVKAIQKGQLELGVSAQIGKILWNITLIYCVCGLFIGQFEFKLIMTISSFIFFIILTLLVIQLARNDLTKGSALIFFALLSCFLLLNLLFIF